MNTLSKISGLVIVFVLLFCAQSFGAGSTIHALTERSTLLPSDMFVLDDGVNNWKLSFYKFWNAGSYTNIQGASISYLTNAGTQLVVFGAAFEYRDFQTNAAFAFVGFSGQTSTNVQTTVYWVTNSTASVFNITPPAGMVATNGTWNCTNLTGITYVNNGKKWTNGTGAPIK